MKFTKVFIQLFAAGLLISSTSCQQQYPDLGDGIFAEFVTSKDTIIIQLFYDKVPLTVANFIGLAEGSHPMLADSLKGKPYYNGTVFHRVIDNFMIQGGDGSPAPPSIMDEFDSTLSNVQKTISMANSGPNTGTCQFFINLVDNTYLDFDKAPLTSKHPVFGITVSGFMDGLTMDFSATSGTGIQDKSFVDVKLSATSWISSIVMDDDSALTTPLFG